LERISIVSNLKVGVGQHNQGSPSYEQKVYVPLGRFMIVMLMKFSALKFNILENEGTCYKPTGLSNLSGLLAYYFRRTNPSIQAMVGISHALHQAQAATGVTPDLPFNSQVELTHWQQIV
jgi:hypothetical protein